MRLSEGAESDGLVTMDADGCFCDYRMKALAERNNSN